MGIMGRVERAALRANMPGPLDDFWYQNVGGTVTYAGLPVSPDVAMRVSVVHACVEVLSMTLASLSLRLYKNLPNGGNERAVDHPLYPILNRRPNSWQTRFEFIEYLVRQLFLRGNGYAEKDFQTLELVPLHPDRVTVDQLANRALRYRVKPPNGMQYTLAQESMLHLRDAGDDAITGQARTALAREAIAVAAAAERFSGRWLQNDGSGRVVLKHPARLDDIRRAEIRKSWEENSAGWQNRGKLAIAEGGTELTVLPGLAESGFLIDPRKFQLAEICRYFGRVPPFMIGHEDKTTWGTNIEQIKNAFVTFCLKPVGDRIEQALMRDLLAEDEQEEYFIAFDYAGLLRGDLLSVVQAIAIERQQGLLSPNEGRALLNLNPRTDPGGDAYQQTPTGAAPNAGASGPGAPPAGTKVCPDCGEDIPAAATVCPECGAKLPTPAQPPEPAEPTDPNAAAIPAPILIDAVDRIANAELREVEKRAAGAAADPARFAAWAHRFYGKHRGYALKVLTPLGAQFGLAAWALETAATRIETTGVAALGAAGVPAGWTERRHDEIAAILEETIRAAAAVAAAA